MKTRASKELKVSVALCTFNGERFLPEQLDSIAVQTRLPDELVICDDCSTDNTVGVIETFAATAPFAVRIYHNQENLGSTKNFERVIGLCAGEIIALCDQDDVWHPDKLRVIEETFDRRLDVGMVFSDLEAVDENGNALGYRAWQSVRFGARRQRRFNKRPLNVLLKHNVVTGCAMAFRANWRDVVLPIPPVKAADEVHHDYWIALMIGAVSGSASINIPLVKYRQHAGQKLGLPMPAAMNEQQRLKRWLRERADYQPALFEAIRAQLCSTRAADHINDFEKRETHTQRRLRSKELRFLKRSLLVARELVTLRYFRYSEGWSDVGRDITPARLLGICLFLLADRRFSSNRPLPRLNEEETCS